MAKKTFKWYLHETYEHSEIIEVLTDARFGGLTAEEAGQAAENMPFYEVGFDCVLDTETGAVEFTLAE